MKKTFILLLIFFSLNSFAGEMGKELIYPQWIYENLAETFPEFNEPLGGFSAEVLLKDLSCSSRNLTSHDEARMEVRCTAVNWNGVRLEREGTKLFLALLNSGLVPDQRTNPGTSTIKVIGLSCAVIAPRTTPENENWPPEEYSCLHYDNI